MQTRALLVLSILLSSWACGGEEPPVEPPKCAAPEDCPAGQQCAPDGRCIAGAECVSDEPCVAQNPRKVCNLTSFVCEFRPGFGDECGPDRPCAFGQFCSSLLGLCLDAGAARDCTRRGQCPAGQTCDREANKCVADLGCYGDEFCESGETCDLISHTCRQVAIECTRCSAENTCANNRICVVDKRECITPGGDASCGEGEFCDPLSRCVQCINNDQCGVGLICNPSVGRCESNVQCADDPSQCPTAEGIECVVCTAPQICDRRSHRCQAPPTPCEDDGDCAAGDELCDQEQDPPICVPRIPDCLGDLLEPNNSAPGARLLEGEVFDELKLCPADADWYRIDVAAGTYLTIDARFRQSRGDVDLQLFLADGRTLVDEARSITDNERVELEVGTDLTLLLRVFLAVPVVSEVPYRLIVTREPGLVCADDGHEPDDVLGSAVEITSDMPYEGRVCPADPDWFVLRNVPAGTRITAELDFTSSLGDLDLELYRLSSAAPILSASTVTDGERLELDASFAGDYYVRVFGKQADGNVYTLRVNTRPNPAAMCVDDRFEPNNAPLEGASTSSVSFEAQGLSICAGDEDWYLMHLLPGDAITAEVNFDPPADLELKLYAPGAVGGTSAPIRLASGTSNREFLARRVFQEGDYALRVHGLTSRDQSRYDLRLERVPFDVCTGDFVDAQGRGNTRLDAFEMPLPPSRLDKLQLCFGDSDWYRLLLIGGFTNIIRLQYIEDDANLELAVFDANGGQLVATNATGTDYKELVANVPGQGLALIYVQVQLNGGFESDYNLTIDLVPTYTCLTDAGEPNETLDSASTLTATTAPRAVYENLNLCTSTVNPMTGAGDEDWYVLTPPRAGARMTVELEHQQGDLFLELLSPGGARRACLNGGANRCYSDGFDLDELVTFTATTTQPYLLRVGSIYSSPNAPVRPLNVDTGYRLEIEYQ